MRWDNSRSLYQEACKWIPGGVNSPVRSARAVGVTPLFVKQGHGCWIVDEDGNRYVDHVCSWGPLIAGHAHPKVVEAISQTAMRGTSYGIPSRLEGAMAQKVVEMVRSMGMVRLVSSGTEATMGALRAARAATGRPGVIKFSGCLPRARRPLAGAGRIGRGNLRGTGSAGVPEAVTQHTFVAEFNDLRSVEGCIGTAPERIAAVIVEPVVGNMGVLLPDPGFLQSLREITTRHGVLLILDEVMTGFRLQYGGVQQRYGVEPDLTCLGKIVGGGLPLAAFGGNRAVMQTANPFTSNHAAPSVRV